MKLFRIFSLFLCALVCAAFLSSCGLIIINHPDKEKNPSSGESSTDSVSGEDVPPSYHEVKRDYTQKAKEYFNSVEGGDFGGAVMKIVTTAPEFTSAEDAPDIVSKAVADRNLAVEKKYNISIVSAKGDEASVFADISASMKSGLYYADMLLLPQNSIASLATSGLTYNLRSMPKLDLTSPFFNQSAVESASAGYMIFGTAGEATYSPFSLSAVYFSHEKLDELGLEYPYRLAKSGEWTWDKLNEYIVAVSGTFNSLALGAHGDYGIDSAFASMGGKFISAGAMKYPTVAIDIEGVQPLLDKLCDAFQNPFVIAGENSGIPAFSQCAFMIDSLGSMSELKDSDFSWGIVPLPKFDESQESYTSLASPSSYFFCVPANVSADSRVSLVLQSFFAASYKSITASLCDHAMMSMLRDNESSNMLELITENIVYDFSYTVGNLYSAVPPATYYAIRNCAYGTNTIGNALAGTVGSCEYALSSAFHMS